MYTTFTNAKYLSIKEKSDNNATFPTYYKRLQQCKQMKMAHFLH
jgi:hypothetical protein